MSGQSLRIGVMDLRLRKGFVLCFLLLGALLMAGAGAELEQPALRMDIGGPVVQGKGFEVTATLQGSGGQPLKAKNISFYGEASFGEYELGTRRTSSDGTATIPHSLPYPGTSRLRAVFPGDSSFNEAGASIEVEVRSDPESMLGAFTGPRVPVLIKVIVAALIGAVWSVYAFVLYQLYLIRKEGEGRVL